MLVFAAIGISSPLITLFLEGLGASYAQIALILTAFSGTALASQYLWGRVSDRLGRRKPVLLAGLFGLSLAYALLSLAPTLSWAWATRVLEGASLAAYFTTSLALMGDLLALSGERGRRMGAYRGWGSLAFAVGAVAGGVLGDAFSLRFSLTICAALYLLAALSVLALKEVPLSSAADVTEAPERLPLRFLAGVALWMTALAASVSMWPNFMATLGYSQTVISSLWGLAALVEAPAMKVLGGLSDVIGRAPILALGGAGIALTMLGYITFAHSLAALVGVQVLRGLAFAGYTATAMTFAAEIGDARSRGGNSGLFNAATNTGQLLGVLIGGTLVQSWGFEVLFAACAAIALASGLLFLTLRTRSTVSPTAG